MKRVESNFTDEEWKEVEKYLSRHEISVYTLLKVAVLEKVRSEPIKNPGPLDEFLEDPA